jgi:hypothetical protein
MRPHQANRMVRDLAVEQSLDAAIEIDEVIRGVKQRSPAFQALVSSLVGSPVHEFNAVKKELLSDSRLTSLYYRAMGSSGKSTGSMRDLDQVLELLLSVSSADLSNISRDDLLLVRDFCLGLNQELVSEAFSRTPEPPLSKNRQQRLTPANAC